MHEIEVNKVFWECLTTDKRYVHSYGGRGSGKSHHEAINFILRIIQPQFFRGVLVREVSDTIRASQFQLIKDLIEKYGLGSRIIANESRMEFYCVATGNSIISTGLKKSAKTETAKFKSIADPTHVWIEEAEEISEDDFNKIDGSVRKVGVNCQIRFTYNTNIEPEHWIRQRFHKAKRSDTYYLHTIYKDNLSNLNRDYIISREQLATIDPERYAVEVLGEWGAKKVISPFANAYKPEKHFKECEYRPEIPLGISFDFNIDPFAFIYYQFWHDKEGFHMHVFGEETIQGGTISEGCDRILQKFGRRALVTASITGDYSGTSRNMMEPDKANIYQAILNRLGISKSQLDIRPNPTHRNSREQVNYLFTYFPDLRIGKNCLSLERDLRIVEVDPDGSIRKQDRKKDEQKADHLDAFRYAINTHQISEWIKQHQRSTPNYAR